MRPYYLYQCDEVQGTEHLRTPVETGLNIIEGMRGHTSGLAIPTFVIDLPEGGGKVPLQPNYVVSQTDKSLILRNYQRNLFHYRNPVNSNSMESADTMVAEVDKPVSIPQKPLVKMESQLRKVKDEDRAVIRP